MGGSEADLPGWPFCTLGLLSEILGGLGGLTSCGVSMGTGDGSFRFTGLATETLLSFLIGAVGGFASTGTGTAWPCGGGTPARWAVLPLFATAGSSSMTAAGFLLVPRTLGVAILKVWG